MIAAALVLAVGYVSAASATDQGREWFTLSVDGNRTGYAFEERRVDNGIVIEHAVTTIIVRELGRRARIEYDATLRSDAAGHPLTFDYHQETGIDNQTWHGEFARGQLILRQHDGTQWKETRVDVPPGAIVSPRQDARIAANAQETLRVVFNPQRKTFAEIDVERVDAEHIVIRFAGDRQERLRLDAAGHIVEAESFVLGQPLLWQSCAHDCDARVVNPMDAMDSLVVRSPVRVAGWYRHRSIRYVLSRSDGRAPEAVETAEQDVVRDGDHIVLTVCDDCGHEAPASPADLERFLAPNAWVRSDDAQIRHIAHGAVGGANVREAMRSLTGFTALKMRGGNDFLGYADAVTALHTGSGDCTEFAVLLASLARARGIPARLAVGLVYSARFSGRKDMFSPHMWVQAWDGTRWLSFDAALDGFDSTHIALGISDGDPASVSAIFATLPVLRMDKAGVLRTP